MFKYLIKPSQYFDSVSLMNIAQQVRELPGIEDAALVMGTDANKRLLDQIAPLENQLNAACPTDLIVVVTGTESALDQALVTAEKLLSQRPTTSHQDTHRPRTLRGALRSQPDTNLVVISVAGQYATAEAWDALRQGKHVLLFSDNVSIEDEIALKRYAVAHDLLLMGPGAGTAIINGAALGFANAVPRGPVGIVSAAGTGLQEVSTLLAKHGVGISQGIGIGGRDLSEAVGGLMFMHAFRALKDDTTTQVIVCISKLPAPSVAQKMLSEIASTDKPVVVIFLGKNNLKSPSSNVYIKTTLRDTARQAAELAQVSSTKLKLLQMQTIQSLAERQPSQIYVRGLFSGGTLCEEAMRIWSEKLGGIWSNGPLDPAFKLPDSSQSQGHCALDLGEEEFTVGRPHPMIDNDLRIRRLLREARDPQVAVIQMDIVLGYGAHPDPASELGPAIRQAREIAVSEGRDLMIVTSITGTDADPQNLSRQTAALEAAGAVIAASNADASENTISLVGGTHAAH
jgi:FdrA protein